LNLKPCQFAGTKVGTVAAAENKTVGDVLGGQQIRGHEGAVTH